MGMIDSISCGQARRLAKPIVLTTAANIVELAPFAFLTLVVAQIVSGAADIAAMWAACAAMGVLLIATFVVEHFAINASFSDGYKVSAESRTRFAEHIRKLPLGVLDDLDETRSGDAENRKTCIDSAYGARIAVAFDRAFRADDTDATVVRGPRRRARAWLDSSADRHREGLLRPLEPGGRRLRRGYGCGSGKHRAADGSARTVHPDAPRPGCSGS